MIELFGEYEWDYVEEIVWVELVDFREDIVKKESLEISL